VAFVLVFAAVILGKNLASPAVRWTETHFGMEAVHASAVVPNRSGSNIDTANLELITTVLLLLGTSLLLAGWRSRA
jgi:hypothetical protein